MRPAPHNSKGGAISRQPKAFRFVRCLVAHRPPFRNGKKGRGRGGAQGFMLLCSAASPSFRNRCTGGHAQRSVPEAKKQLQARRRACHWPMALSTDRREGVVVGEHEHLCMEALACMGGGQREVGTPGHDVSNSTDTYVTTMEDHATTAQTDLATQAALVNSSCCAYVRCVKSGASLIASPLRRCRETA